MEVEAKKSLMKVEITKKKVPRKEIMHFSRQMGVFMKAGIPIMEALEVIALETTEKLMKKVIVEMIDDLRAGDTFTAAAAAHPEAFPNFYVGILESAELTGNLDISRDFAVGLASPLNVAFGGEAVVLGRVPPVGRARRRHRGHAPGHQALAAPGHQDPGRRRAPLRVTPHARRLTPAARAR